MLDNDNDDEVFDNRPIVLRAGEWELCESARSDTSELQLDQLQLQLETKASSHEGQCIPAGCRVTLLRRTLIAMSIITMRSRLFRANSASTAILRILWRHLQTDLRNV